MPIRIAFTKGRLEQDTVRLFESAGIECSGLRDKGRRLIVPIGGGQYEAVLAKAPDVITYVEHGVCDIGVVGKDTIMEYGSSFYEVCDLGFGRCVFVLAAPRDGDFYGGYNIKRVATKYPRVARAFFESKNMDIQVIKIEGSVELAPLLGLADGIVDIVETGTTLKENGLEVVEKISDISARLIVNTACLKLKKAQLESFIGKIEKQLKGGAELR